MCQLVDSVTQGAEDRIGDGDEVALISLRQLDDAIAVAHAWQWLQEHAVRYAEDGGRTTDPERQRSDRKGREPRSTPQRAQREFHIAAHDFEMT